MDKKRVYTFGNGQAEGKADMKNLLGGKGANLAEMNLIGIPVPPGFTITTDVCTEYNTLGRDKVVELLKDEVVKAIANVEALMKSKFGDIDNPLLVSVRSGARASMPGMMDTILNLGLNDEVVEGIIRKTGNARFAWDSYRRFVQMYGDVVLGMKPTNKEDIDPFEKIIEEVKHAKGVKLDNELEVEDLKELIKKFKAAVKEQTGKDFPTCAYEQLWGAICAVFDSWMNERAILYRKMEGIPDEWGTAVNVQNNHEEYKKIRQELYSFIGMYSIFAVFYMILISIVLYQMFLAEKQEEKREWEILQSLGMEEKFQKKMHRIEVLWMMGCAGVIGVFTLWGACRLI